MSNTHRSSKLCADGRLDKIDDSWHKYRVSSRHRILLIKN